MHKLQSTDLRLQHCQVHEDAMERINLREKSGKVSDGELMNRLEPKAIRHSI